MDFIEREREFVLRADIPGVHKSEIRVSVDGNVVRFGHQVRVALPGPAYLQGCGSHRACASSPACPLPPPACLPAPCSRTPTASRRTRRSRASSTVQSASPPSAAAR